jgi:hypothetical protein
MKVCKYCGNVTETKKKYCPSCGGNLSTPNRGVKIFVSIIFAIAIIQVFVNVIESIFRPTKVSTSVEVPKYMRDIKPTPQQQHDIDSLNKQYVEIEKKARLEMMIQAKKDSVYELAATKRISGLIAKYNNYLPRGYNFEIDERLQKNNFQLDESKLEKAPDGNVSICRHFSKIITEKVMNRPTEYKILFSYQEGYSTSHVYYTVDVVIVK